MHLFTQLLKLHKGGAPTEDFLTELACAVLRLDTAFARRWLEQIGVPSSLDARISVRSQVGTSGLDSHDSDSRIDIVIELAADDSREVVFVEAKVSAVEGHQQLRRYAEVLRRDAQDARCRYLVYLTAEHDPKPSPEVPGVIFRQARWHHFHRLLRGAKSNPLIEEVLHFMESKGLSQGDRFSASDLVALRNLKHLVNLLEASLGGEVLRRLRKLTGRTYLDANLLKSMRNQGAWTLEARWDEAQTGLTVGFIQPDSDDPAAFPLASVLFWVAPNAPSAAVLRKAFRAACAGGEWSPRGLDQSDKWFGMRLERPFEAILPEQDHVKALQRYFIDGIGKAEAWMEENPSFISSAPAGSASSPR